MKKLIILTFVILLAGCASAPGDSNYLNGKSSTHFGHPIYGKLLNIDGKYVFKEFSTGYDSRYNKDEPWVRLNDMNPMWSTEKEDCMTGFTFEEDECTTENEVLFRKKSTDFTGEKTTRYLAYTVFSLGLASTNVPAAVEFDEKKYKSAIKNAENDLNDKYGSSENSYEYLLEEYDNDKKYYEEKSKMLIEDRSSTASPVFNIRDDSGLFETNPTVFEKLVSTSRDYRDLYSKRKYHRSKSLINLVEQVKNENSIKLRKLEVWASTLSVRCNANGIDNVNYRIECPDDISSSTEAFDVYVVVDSVDYDKVLPAQMYEENEHVSLSFKNNYFYLVNKTGSYISLDRLSFYHNGKIATLSNLRVELPPHAESVLMSIERLPIDYDAVRFRNITKSSVDGISIEYGVALKYRVVNSNSDNTLFKTRNYKLKDLI